MVHRVDVSTHAPAWVGGQVMDQLTFPDWLWRAMYSRRAYPNRVRPGEYRRLAGEAGLESARFEVTGQVSREEVERFRPRLARRFRDCAWEDLATADFLWVLRHGPRVESALNQKRARRTLPCACIDGCPSEGPRRLVGR
jgi:hypothetical protein